jgi:hypothetical protein
MFRFLLQPPFINPKRKWLRSAIGATAVTIAPAAFAAAAALVTGDGTYYAVPAWDQTFASKRFVVLTNMGGDAALDRETGLVWHRTVSAPGTFGQVSSACLRSKIGGRLGWRLPTVNELASLFDTAATTAPFLPDGHPFVDFPRYPTFWTATPYAIDLTIALFHSVSISPSMSGDLLSFGAGSNPTNPHYALCVRGGTFSGAQ